MMQTVVYADILFAVNWIVDYFLLVGTAALAASAVSRGRLLLGAALGGASAFIFLAPPLPLWMQWGYQLLSGTLVLLAAFRLRPGGRLRSLVKLWFWYFLLNLCYAGLVLGAMYWLSAVHIHQNNLAFYYNVPPLLLVGCILAMYALLRLLLILFEAPHSEKIVRAVVEAAGQTLEVDVLVDSGFTASDAMLGQPLLLLSYPDTVGALRQTPAVAVGGAGGMWLAARLQACFAGGQPAAEELPPGLRLVPLHTVAGGMLAPALTAQAVIGGRNARVTLAFCNERFRAGRVQGLFGAKSYEMIGGF